MALKAIMQTSKIDDFQAFIMSRSPDQASPPKKNVFGVRTLSKTLLQTNKLILNEFREHSKNMKISIFRGHEKNLCCRGNFPQGIGFAQRMHF